MHLRDPFLLKLALQKTPAIFVVFDVLSKELDTMPLKDRKLRISDIKDAGRLPSWVMILPWTDEFEEIWKKVLQLGWEGVVVKQADSLYEQRRSKSWIKVKSFLETTAEFVKYEDHPRGITITTADDRRVVVNGAQAPEVRHAIIKDGKVQCDIQYMPSTLEGSEAWRFPSFRGISKAGETQ